MGLAYPLPGGYRTQGFGLSHLSIEPSAWVVGDSHAYWLPIPRSTFAQNVHVGVDFGGKPAGSPLVACESGVVTRREYDGVNGGGWVVEVEIRPNVRYSFAHCSRLLVALGQRVRRGQTIAEVGATGTLLTPDGYRIRSTYGVHLHAGLTIREPLSDGIWRGIMYNLEDFLVGGRRADDARIKPERETRTRVRFAGPGINARTSPNLDVGDANLWATSRADGIYLRRSSRRIGPLGMSFKLLTRIENDDGRWVKFRSPSGHSRWIKRELATLS